MSLLPQGSIDEVMNLAAESGDSLVYLVMTEVSGAAVLVHPDGLIDSVELPDLDDEAVNAWTERLSELEGGRSVVVRGVGASIGEDGLTQVAADRLVAEVMDELKQTLSPLRSRLDQSARLVPTGRLAQLPIAAVLSVMGEALTVHVGVSALLHGLSLDRESGSGRSMGVFAAPIPCSVRPGVAATPLPGAVDEAEWLSAAFGAQTCSGSDATKEALLLLLTTPMWGLHLATHGVCVPEAPEESAALCRDGGDGLAERLTVGELSGYRVGAELIFLAACWLGQPGEDLPDEAIGFPTLLCEAGAKAVIAPLWPVPDEATFGFVKTFYSYARRGYPPARALALAQAEFGELAPSAWGAFFLTGG
jgi:CHAT domain-containing protein